MSNKIKRVDIKNKRVAVYCRVAREENDEPEQQKDPLRIFAENNGIPLTTVTDPLKFYDWLRTNEKSQAPTKIL